MTEENIRVRIDDAELEIVKQKIDTANRQTGTLNKQITDARRTARAAGISLDDLPTLNRDLRILGSTLGLPGFRQASALLFQARRGVRAGQLAREAGEIAELDPALAGQLTTQALLGQAALVAFVTKVAVDSFVQFTRDQQMKNVEFEDMIRDNLELTFKEFDALSSEQIGFATLFNQIQEETKDQGLVETIRQTTRDLIIESFFSLIPDWINEDFLNNLSLYID